MGGHAAGDLWRHQAWSPSWILPRISNHVKTGRIGNCLCLKCEMIHASFYPQAFLSSFKEVEKHSRLLLKNWPPATYDVITCNHSNWSSLNLSLHVRVRVIMFVTDGRKSSLMAKRHLAPNPRAVYFIKIIFFLKFRL